MSTIAQKFRPNAGIHLEEFSLSKSETSNAIVTIQQQGFLDFRFESTHVAGKANVSSRYEIHFSMPLARACKEVEISVEGDAEMCELVEAMRAFVGLADKYPHLITRPEALS